MAIKPNLLYQVLGFCQREMVLSELLHCPELLSVSVSCLHLAWLAASLSSLVFSLWWWLWLWKMNGTDRCHRCAVQVGFAQEPSCALPALLLIFRSPAAPALKPARHTAPHRWRCEQQPGEDGNEVIHSFMNKPNSNPGVWTLILD